MNMTRFAENILQRDKIIKNVIENVWFKIIND